MTAQIDWHSRAAIEQFEGRAFINGAYCAAASGKTFATVNPATRSVLCSIADCGEFEVNAAVHAARVAFDDGRWAELAPVARKSIMLRFAALIREHADELALLETLDTGKPIADSLAVDIAGSAYCIQWYAEAIDKVGGEIAPLAGNLVGMVTREPIGVVAAVVPWNFPLLMASWKIAPALAAGNSVILKPSEKSPLTAIRIAALAKQAGIPDGVLQVLPGAGTTGRLLAEHHDVDCIAFTGSTAVGKLISQAAAQSNLKRVWLELGGKSPNIILADCPDITAAANAAAGGIFYNQGEMCSAGSRVLVQRAIYPQFIAALQTAAQVYTPGDPLDPATRMGAIVDQIQYDKVLAYIEAGKAEADHLRGGDAVMTETGLFITPAIFKTAPDTTIAREEIFGPVCSVIVFDTPDEAIQIANNSEYGLAAAVWTSNLSTAHTMAKKLRAGTVWVNCYDEGGDMNLPFGGYKQSGNGRDKSLHALEKYTELKTTLIKL
ncbi:MULTISPECIES: aldehyde dehydrogenase [Deefgea]|uniref:Aldehyde dehydrogenase family protein n=1 Tax=Deefgea chitinilytica TaxID=570276 RepID=A0ABS2CDL7_9NEIS|nr:MULTISPECIES: aldehyde dehydrogenase [Deefgea]MBM5572122.1 aldehyde dehydrogenase family protein [Deefgea chitinilytica]MBM9889357.1 aldehyde dehydrogenase [Deefgea sp. CFH1-16]